MVESRRSLKFTLLGIGCLFVYLASAAVFMLNTQDIGLGTAWDKPYMESYLYHGVWVLVFPIAALAYAIEKRFREQPFPGMPWGKLIVWGAISGPLIVITSWAYYVSLAHLSLSVNSSLNNTQFILVFVASLIFLAEKVNAYKLLGCAFALGGIVMIYFGSLPIANDSQSTTEGYLWLVGSLVGSTIYIVLYCKIMGRVQEDWGVSSVLGLTSISMTGLSACLLTWVGVIIGNYTGLEPFAFPHGKSLDQLFVGMLTDCLLNLAYLFGLLFTSATFMSVGALLNIGTSTFMQFVFLGSVTLEALGAGGVIMVVVGVLIFEFNTVLNALSVRVLVAAGLMINESDEEEKQPLVINQEQQQQEQQQEHVL